MLSSVQAMTPVAPTGVPFPTGRLSEADRRKICKRVSAKHDMPFDMANDIMSDLVVFLSASVAYEEAIFSPPEIVDFVWHEFILHSNAYLDFCNSLGVLYIHHIPDDDENKNSERTRAKSVPSILDKIGVPFNRSFWNGNIAECNGCDKGIQHWPETLMTAS
jgi:hypothetical protein